MKPWFQNTSPKTQFVQIAEAAPGVITAPFLWHSLDSANRSTKGANLPTQFPSYQTVHRRFQQCNEQKVFDHVFFALAQDLKDLGKLDLSECSMDAVLYLPK